MKLFGKSSTAQLLPRGERLLIAGKILGLAMLAAIVFVGPHVPEMLLGGGSAVAQETAAAAPPDPYAAVKPADHINAMNTGWVLLGAILVFGMQAGFTMLEAGFCRNRETVNVLVECVFDTCVCGLLHWGWGFAFMFGEGNQWIGWHAIGNPKRKLHLHEGCDRLLHVRCDGHSRFRSLPLPIRIR